MSTDPKRPYDYIARHYREPTTSDPIQRWLPHPEVARAVCAALLAGGMPPGAVEDGLQDVYVKALAAFHDRTPVPADLHAMKAYCATVAKNHAIDRRRKADRRRGELDEDKDVEQLAPGRDRARERDPIDAGRQLDVVVSLLRQGRMPRDGAEILEGVASRCSYKEIAQALDITEELAKWRMREMRRIYRGEMAKRGMTPGMQPLHRIFSTPAALEALRRVC